MPLARPADTPRATDTAAPSRSAVVERLNVKTAYATTPVRLATLLLLASLGGCSTISGFFGDEKKPDYQSAAQRTRPLEVPPDLTQLARDSRYQPQGGVISASGIRNPGQATAAAAPGATTAVATTQFGDVRVERDGQIRWLSTPRTPEQVWPQLKTFWEQRGTPMAKVDAPAGILETEWVENKDKVAGDLIRNTLGKIAPGLFDSGLRDRFLTRLERRPDGGSDIFLTHRGAQEIYVGIQRDQTSWQPRQDPALEAATLQQLLMALSGQSAPAAQAAVAQPQAVAPKVVAATATTASGQTVQSTNMVVDEPFDRAWRRVGLALDRGGFTVEDRDRANGLYYVRYIDPKSAGRDEPSWWSKLWNSGKDPAAAMRFRIALKANGNQTNLAVQDSTGQADKGEHAQAIAGILARELR